MPDVREYKLFVNGEWVDAASGETFESLSPSDGTVAGRVAKGGAEDVRRAIEAARKAFDSGVWSEMSQQERSRRMLQAWEKISERLGDLALIEAQDAGHTLRMANLFSIAVGVEHWRALAELSSSFGEYEPVPFNDYPAPAWGLVRREPYGVTAAITPWNFPFILMMWKVAPALATGNTVVIKPAEQTPLSALAVAELAQRAGLPAGVLNVVTGDGENSIEIGRLLCESDAVRHLSFTGSTEVGRILMRQCAPTIKKLSLELGGNAPFIVFDDADLDSAAEGALTAKYRNAGQTCVCANRLYAQEAIYDAFIAKLAEKAHAIRVGNGFEAGITQGPLIDEQALAKVERHVADAVTHGARVVVGGHRIGERFYAPTVLADVTPVMLCSREETFGPLAPVSRFKTEGEAIALANDTEFGLASYFYSRDVGRIFRVGEALEYGMVGVNTGLISTAEVPFGGVKQSGLGREGSRHGIDDYVEIKYLCLGGLNS